MIKIRIIIPVNRRAEPLFLPVSVDIVESPSLIFLPTTTHLLDNALVSVSTISYCSLSDKSFPIPKKNPRFISIIEEKFSRLFTKLVIWFLFQLTASNRWIIFECRLTEMKMRMKLDSFFGHKPMSPFNA